MEFLRPNKVFLNVSCVVRTAVFVFMSPKAVILQLFQLHSLNLQTYQNISIVGLNVRHCDSLQPFTSSRSKFGAFRN